VGNRDGVFVNNWVENATNGFFFEISRGVTVAGNVFFRCGNGVFILNSADARVYNNTFLDAAATFQRNQRSAQGDLFGWHATTGPDVDQREGHVFVNNLLVASEPFRRPLVRFDQPAMMCKRLPRPQAKEIAGNVYVRAALAGETASPALIAWSPAATDSCAVTASSLAEFQKQAPEFEKGARQLDLTPASIFKSPDLKRLDLFRELPGGPSGVTAPADVRKLVGWSEQQARTPGAYPLGR
jgi:parallel beta-helix repeat protein